MPTLTIKKSDLLERISKSFSNDEINDLVFDFGVELDDIYSEDGIEMYKFDIPANRYDLLCIEGFSRALKAYMGIKYEDIEFSNSSITVYKEFYNDNHIDNNHINNDNRINDNHIDNIPMNNDHTDNISINNDHIDNIHINNDIYQLPRPHIACAIIRDISGDFYNSLIEYQEKLHGTICRNRTLAAIGTHDLDKIKGNIIYKSKKTSEIILKPLKSSYPHDDSELYTDQELNSVQDFNDLHNLIERKKGTEMKLLEYKNICNKKISKYFELVGDICSVFECDSGVMSVPPLINSETTKISQNTRNIFVEVTGTDFNKVNSVLKLILYNFRGKRVEKVKITDFFGNAKNIKDNAFKGNTVKGDTVKGNTVKDNINIKSNIRENINFSTNNDSEYSNLSNIICHKKRNENSILTPVINVIDYRMNLKEINSKLGLELKAEEIKDLLERMIYNVKICDDSIIITPLSIRMDVMHKCDIIEDIAISYGFNNFKKILPEISTIGSENILNKFSDKIRMEMALAGFNEALTLTLLGNNENFIENEKQVILSNPKSKEYEVVRTSLIPGLLKTICSNLKSKIPIRIFEVSDILKVFMNDYANNNEFDNNNGYDDAFDNNNVYANNNAFDNKNFRFFSAIICANSSMLEDVQGPLSLLLSKCGLDFKYSLNENLSELYLNNQNATIFVENIAVGTLGVIHPSISKKFKIPYAMSAFEVNLEMIYEIYRKF